MSTDKLRHCVKLHRLEQDGLLVSEAEVVAGKVRRYYVSTAKGRQALEALRPRLAELVGDALPQEPSHVARFRQRRKSSPPA